MSATEGQYDWKAEVAKIEKDWETNPRWAGVARGYSGDDVVKLRGSLNVSNTVATRGANKLWAAVNGASQKGYVNALGALTGGQAVQMAKAGLEAIYLSGWQVAADNNTALTMYPDQSLYPVDSVPKVVESINKSLGRADQIQWSKKVTRESPDFIDYYVPIVADAEAGFGGVLNAFELTKHLISAGASGVHFEDQLSSAKKCGHLGGKVLVPTNEAVQKLSAARLAADVLGVPTLIIARTDANAATLLTSDSDPRDAPFLAGVRSVDGFYEVKAGIDQAIARGLAYAPYADMVWCETSTPSIAEARKFATAMKEQFPNKLLAYNCSPSFNWKKNLDDETIRTFQQELSDMGYKFQFITLAGIHAMWHTTFDLAHEYAKGEGMRHYVEKVQEPEFKSAARGYTFVAHQQEVGTGYFDAVTNVIQAGKSSVCAMSGSTEEAQFH